MEFVIVNAPGVCSQSPRIRAYDGLVRGELEYAMSASSSPQASPHRIAILMSPAGRFLVCRDCKLSFQFPDGVPYGPLAKQFEFHLCLSPTPVPGWRSDRGFVMVRLCGHSSHNGFMCEVSAQVLHPIINLRARPCWS